MFNLSARHNEKSYIHIDQELKYKTNEKPKAKVASQHLFVTIYRIRICTNLRGSEGSRAL